jgi:hypothetical protein
MMSSSAADGFSGLMEWSEPIIFDRLRDAYFDRLADYSLAVRLARSHARVWRALIEGDMGRFENLRAALSPTPTLKPWPNWWRSSSRGSAAPRVSRRVIIWP